MEPLRERVKEQVRFAMFKAEAYSSDFVLREATDAILQAVEEDRAKLKEWHEEIAQSQQRWRSRAEKAEAREAALVADLKDAKADAKSWEEQCKDAREMEAKLAKLLKDLVDAEEMAAPSLANAALRDALERMVTIYEIEWDVDAPWSRPEWLLAALALPADSLAQEVVWLLANFPASMGAPIYTEWWERRTAMLAKLGGPK